MVELCEVSKVYRSLWRADTPALHSVSFSALPGEVLNIWGPRGSGKSTLLKVLGLRTRLTGGLYLLDGTDVSGVSHSERVRLRERMVATTWCDRELLEPLGVREHMSLLGRPNDVQRALLAVGLVDRQDDLVDDLSFAERRRLCWACAIIQGTPLLLADDVARGLTPEETLALVAVARDVAVEGQTIILTSDEPLLDAAIDRAVPIRDGYLDVRTRETPAPCGAVTAGH